MQNPTVSVLMPCAGKGEFFEEAFLSALNQSYKNIRVFVIDNASPSDIYKKTVEMYSDPRVSYVRYEERLALPDNWQRCLRFTGESCFCFLHDDDVWTCNYLKSSVDKLFSSDHVDVVLTWNISFTLPIEMKADPVPDERWLRFCSADKVTRAAMMILGDWGHMSALVFKKNLFSFDTHSLWNLDQRFFHSYALGGRIACCMESPVWFRCYKGNASSNAKSIRNARERDEFVKRELISQMERNKFQEALLSVAIVDPSAAYRLSKAVYSWPLDPSLLAWARSIFREKKFNNSIRAYTGRGKLMSIPGIYLKVIASLMIDIMYLWKARATTK